MDFAAMIAEVQARGHVANDATRAGVFVNMARGDLDDLEHWPYREASATGTAPLVVTDLGTIEAVLDTTTQARLKPADWRDLLAWYGEDLSTSGAPEWFYRATPNGVPEVATYPKSAASIIGVQYWAVTPDLVDGADTPLAPPRFHDIYVDMAVQVALRDRDQFVAAEQLQAHVDRRVATMRNALLFTQAAGPSQYINITADC